jgi:hypothetical protein
LRLLIDEMFSDAVAAGLRDRVHDAISVREAEPSLMGASDEEVLKIAVAEGRSLVTENVRDYRPLEIALLAEGEHHSGIIYTSDRQFPRGNPQTTGRLVRALDSLLTDPPALGDRSMFLAPVGD